MDSCDDANVKKRILRDETSRGNCAHTGQCSNGHTGLGFDYGNGWAGRYYTTEAELLIFAITYRSQVDLDFTDVAGLKNIGPVMQALLNFSGLAGSSANIDRTIPRAEMLSAYQ